MNLHTLKPAAGSIKKHGKRLGRGQGSGKGGTSSKGHKGAQSHGSWKRKRGFEGGQTPLQRRIPKFGFKNINRIEYKGINIGTLQKLVDEHKLLSINKEVLVAHGLVKKKALVKILGTGELTSKIEVKANAFSASAKSAIEKVGGQVIVEKK